jgi:hypothetical protein
VQHPKLQTRAIVYYTSLQHFTNSAINLAAYLMLECGFSPEEAIAPFTSFSPCPLRGFRDATWGKPTFLITALDCLRGLRKALEHNLVPGLAAQPCLSLVDDFDADKHGVHSDPLQYSMNQVCDCQPIWRLACSVPDLRPFLSGFLFLLRLILTTFWKL